MDSLSAGTFQQVVDTGDNQQLVAMFFQMDEALVGIYHLFQVYILVYYMGKRIFRIVFFIHLDDFFQSNFGLYHNCGEDATREITAVRDEIDFGVETVLQLFQRLLDFGNMLVCERLVYTDVVVTPAEVSRRTRLDRKSTRLNSSHSGESRMPSSA